MDWPGGTEEFLRTYQAVLSEINEAKEDVGNNHQEPAQPQNQQQQPPSSTSIMHENPQFPNNLNSILLLHKLVSDHCLAHYQPVDCDLASRIREARSLLNENSSGGELYHLLGKLHVNSVSAVHDNVANRLYEPLLPQIPHEVDEDEGVAVKIVRMVKNDEPLGATIKCEDNGAVVIARVMKGGVADRSGCIQVGDRVMEVNGVSVGGKDPTEIVSLLSRSSASVTFKLIPAPMADSHDGSSSTNLDHQTASDHPSRHAPRSFVKALFSYASKNDHIHPCPEAALSFAKNDVLELLDTRSGSSSLSSREKKLRKVMYEAQESEEFEGEEVKTYSPVALLYPRPGLVRAIVLLGPPGVGRNELKRRLLMLNPDRFASTVPHTSRSPKKSEVDGVDYHFVTRSCMEEWIRGGQFIEYGEYRGNLYGTLKESVVQIINQGRTPVLNPHPQSLRHLRSSEIKPLVVFVRPPPFPALKESRNQTRPRSTVESVTSSVSSFTRGFSDEELRGMINQASDLDANYGHYFDYYLTNGNLEFAFRELFELIQRIDRDPFWVPQSWVT